MEGVIIKALSGFYYVRTAEGLITCRARGLFRKTGESPLVGDRVTIALSGAEGTVETIINMAERKFKSPLLTQTEALAFEVVVVRIEYLGDSVCNGVLSKSLIVVALVEHFHIEVRSFCRPQTEHGNAL